MGSQRCSRELNVPLCSHLPESPSGNVTRGSAIAPRASPTRGAILTTSQRLADTVSTASASEETAIERWSLLNAIAILAAAVVTGFLGSPWPVLLTGAGLLGGLIVVARDRWTAQGHFGMANGVTALRLGVIGFLPAAAASGPTVLVALSILVLAMDGIDGWLARRQGLSSAFGSFFDKETDALLLLVLCFLAVFDARLPGWIVGAGLLRYGFVIFLFVTPTPEKTEEASEWARYIYGATVVSVLAAYVLPLDWAYPLALIATVALAGSFAQSVWRVLQRQPVLGKP